MSTATPEPAAFRAHWTNQADLAVRAVPEDERGAQFDRMLDEHAARTLDDLIEVLEITALSVVTLQAPVNIARREADQEVLEYVRARAAALRDGVSRVEDGPDILDTL